MAKSSKLLKLNLGCGSQVIEGYIGIDCEKSAKPDLLLDFTKAPLPYKDGSVEEIVMFHTIEHIQKRFHKWIFSECFRVLGKGKQLLVSYPDFWICANNWHNNFEGKMDYWHACMFGLQQYPSDFHVCAMAPKELEYRLKEIGFIGLRSYPEKLEKYNKITVAVKGSKPQTTTYLKLLSDELNSIKVKKIA